MDMKNAWKEKIRTALSKVADNRGCPMVVSDTGIPLNSLHNFISTGYLGTDKVKTLEEWLVKHHYLEEKAPDKPPDNYFAPIAKDLRALADILDSEYPQDFKSSKFRCWVELSFKNLDKILDRGKRQP